MSYIITAEEPLGFLFFSEKRKEKKKKKKKVGRLWKCAVKGYVEDCLCDNRRKRTVEDGMKREVSNDCDTMKRLPNSDNEADSD